MSVTPQRDVKPAPTPPQPMPFVTVTTPTEGSEKPKPTQQAPFATAMIPTARSTKPKKLPDELRAPRLMPRPTPTVIAQQRPHPTSRRWTPGTHRPPPKLIPIATEPQLPQPI